MASVEALRVAVVGAGRMGRTHLRALERARGIDAVAIVEPVARVRAQLESAGLRAWSTVDELLAAGGVDAAVIAAPTDLHLDLVTQLAAAQLPLLCEKPCGLNPDETSHAVHAAADAGVVLQVGYWRRFVPALVDLREQLRAGRFGARLLVSCWQWDAQPPPASFRARSGGILLDMGVHEFDQIRWLTGRELVDVVAFAAGVDADSATALVQIDDGTAALVSLGRYFQHGDCCWLELMGTAGHARELFMWGDDGLRVFEDALVAQAEAFAGAVRGEPQRGASGDDAVRAIEAADRAARSLAATSRT
jgi:myo-inositol 2-dehydrogenase/D-chiro-inositol 1-dehydrogenase